MKYQTKKFWQIRQQQILRDYHEYLAYHPNLSLDEIGEFRKTLNLYGKIVKDIENLESEKVENNS